MKAALVLPEGWHEVADGAADRLLSELHGEVPAQHLLAGRALRAIARRYDRDDVLFQAGDDSSGPVFCVHLTWGGKAPDSRWPSTKEYADISDFLERWPGEDAP